MISELTNMGISPSAFRLPGESIKHNVNFRIVVQFLHKGSHHCLVIGFICPYLVGHFLFAVFPDVGLSTFHDGVLEVAVYHHNSSTLCHQIVSKGDAKSSLSNASLLIGKCHYNRSLYHFKY